MVRIGVIGLGFMGATHITAIQRAGEDGIACELTAVCDRKPSRRRGELWDVGGNAVSDMSARKPAFEANRVCAYSDADALLADGEVDLVCICTRTDTHIDLATRALRAGKHVLVEKPVSLIAQEIRELDRIAKDAGKLCMPAMCMRFWPAWRYLKECIDDGRFGRCVSLSLQRLASMPRWSPFFADGAKSGGALVDLHIHDADFVYWCFGKPDSVSSVGCVGASGAIDHVTTIYRHATPRTARHVVAEGGWDHHDGFAFRMRYVAIFERATLDFDLTREEQLLLCRDGKSEPVAMENLSGYDLQLRHMVQAIAEGRSTTIATLEDAENVAELLDAERESVLGAQGEEMNAKTPRRQG